MWNYLPFFVSSTTTILFHLKCYVHGSRSCIAWKLKKFENTKSMKQLLGLSSGLCMIWILCVMKMEHSQTIWFCRDNFLWPCYFEKTWLLWLVCLKYFFMSIWTFVLNLSDLNIHITIKNIYIEIMPKYHSTSKILFYHLPTRGRAGIKLGDAWYVSNVSIIFDCSMLLYLLF